jgi:hypothetical protein
MLREDHAPLSLPSALAVLPTYQQIILGVSAGQGANTGIVAGQYRLLPMFGAADQDQGQSGREGFVGSQRATRRWFFRSWYQDRFLSERQSVHRIAVFAPVRKDRGAFYREILGGRL